MKVQTIMQQIAGGVFMGKVITIAREFGSGGRIIAQSLAEQLKIGFYDKNLITLAAERKNLPEERLERVDERRENPWRYDMEDDIAIQRQFYYEPLKDVTEDCVIVGRCADYLLRIKPDCRCVFITAPLEKRIRTISARTGLDAKAAKQLIKKVDKQRKYYYENYTDRKWGKHHGYDLCLDSSRLTKEQILKILTTLYETIE